MNYPAASNGVSNGNYYRPKDGEIKPLSAHWSRANLLRAHTKCRE